MRYVILTILLFASSANAQTWRQIGLPRDTLIDRLRGQYRFADTIYNDPLTHKSIKSIALIGIHAGSLLGFLNIESNSIGLVDEVTWYRERSYYITVRGDSITTAKISNDVDSLGIIGDVTEEQYTEIKQMFNSQFGQPGKEGGRLTYRGDIADTTWYEAGNEMDLSYIHQDLWITYRRHYYFKD